MNIPVGLVIWSRLVEKTFTYLDQVIAPFDSIWMPDHVQYGNIDVAEGWTLFAYALARYPDKIVGHDVLCNSFRNPALLAKMTATAQAISGGRVVLGLGAGWNEEEYRAYGYPFPSAKVRIEEMSEAIQLIRAMWTDSPANFHGQHFQIENIYCEPRPDPLPPIMLGTQGEKYGLRVVAEYGDWWNVLYKDLDSYRHKQNVLKEHCRDVGRDYDEIVQVVHIGVHIGATERDVRAYHQQPDARKLGDNYIEGTPEQITETLLEIAKHGATRFSIHFIDVPKPDCTFLFAGSVLPHLESPL
ncbi:MAG: LLM class flavin-dependent oxidoreductase [Chloroflexota bacterium]